MKELLEEILEVEVIEAVEEIVVMISVSFAEKGVTLPEIAETKELEVLEATDLHAEVDEAGVAAEVLEEEDPEVEVEAPEREGQVAVQDDTKVDQKVRVLTKRRQREVIAEVRVLMQRLIRNEARAIAGLDPGLNQRMERRKTMEKTVLKEEKDPLVLSLSNLEISHQCKIR